MPIFEYECATCGNEFETLVRAGAAAECPGCGSTDLEKKLSVPARPVSRAEAAQAAGPCGMCGHPDGPGACKLN